MGKLVVVAGIAIAAFLAFRPHGASADKVADCLQQSGATVSLTPPLRGGEGLPRQIKNRLLEVEKRNVQRAGKFVMYWRIAPHSESTGILLRCLP